MTDFKKQAASAAVELIFAGQIIGLGAGSTIAHLAEELAKNPDLLSSISVVTSSTDTFIKISELGFKLADIQNLTGIDLYFDGCDQLDHRLNAFKSGAGIHTDEKILAAMAERFILLGDINKMTQELNTQYPFVMEVFPESVKTISYVLSNRFDINTINIRTISNECLFKTKRNNLLIDVHFNTLPDLSVLNQIKNWPGVVDHSLFYQMASSAILFGPGGRYDFH